MFKVKIFIFIACLTLATFANAMTIYDSHITKFEEEQLLVKEFPSNYIFETITDCSNDNDILVIENIFISPDPPRRGENVYINASGYLKKTVGFGSYVDLTVKLGLIKLLHQKLDLCEQVEKVDKSCPLEEGEQYLETTVTLPKEIPFGKYTVEAYVYTADEERITCLKANVMFKP
ncbi:2631_t:CDS:2 [Funneliformis caledonium]|uniref:Phosphatidylglycerol/phosphatidylinositol transfer protein n=1 Tax=Funneliformis caledonium TaxID=1117310 RepID=A0A9N9A8M9_9GLOM|nr:2631_t:CDS:2 [Funneliformis caledonium]